MPHIGNSEEERPRKYPVEYKTVESKKITKPSLDSLSTVAKISSQAAVDSIELIHYTEELDFNFVNMTESRYAGVVFTEIQDSYPTDADIECRFLVNKSIEIDANDKVGLFKVGWNDASEAFAFKSSSECELDPIHRNERFTRFRASCLPPDAGDNDFFQFCYISSLGNICGLSTPFQVYRPLTEDLIELTDKVANAEDDDDFVVVRSQQALLQERLQQLTTNNGFLEFSNKTMENKLAMAEKECSEFKAHKIQLENKVEKLQLEINFVVEKLRKSQSKEIEQTETIEVTNRDLVKYRNLLKDKENELQEVKKYATATQEQERDLINKLSKTMGEKNDLHRENSTLKSRLEDMKAMIQTHESNRNCLLDELKKMENEKAQLSDELIRVKISLDSLEALVQLSNAESSSKQKEWEKKENEMQETINELTLRLKKAAEEYQSCYKHSLKTENKLTRLQQKIEKFVQPRKQTTTATSIPETATQTEVKKLLQDELEASKDELSLDDVALITLPCALCKEDIYCTVRDLRPMTIHLEDVHKQRVCPVCSRMFDSTLGGVEEYFHMHVESHFDARNSAIQSEIPKSN